MAKQILSIQKTHICVIAANIKKAPEKFEGFLNTPGGIRIPDLLVRSQTLYPAELQALTFSPEKVSKKTFDTLCGSLVKKFDLCVLASC